MKKTVLPLLMPSLFFLVATATYAAPPSQETIDALYQEGVKNEEKYGAWPDGVPKDIKSSGETGLPPGKYVFSPAPQPMVLDVVEDEVMATQAAIVTAEAELELTPEKPADPTPLQAVKLRLRRLFLGESSEETT